MAVTLFEIARINCNRFEITGTYYHATTTVCCTNTTATTMTDSDSLVVDLNSLNKKQLAKEFKATVKDIKAKDPAKKRDALDKFKNPRYLLEGGCFIPFLQSLTPKPVSSLYFVVV